MARKRVNQRQGRPTGPSKAQPDHSGPEHDVQSVRNEAQGADWRDWIDPRKIGWLNLLLVFVPLGIGLRIAGVGETWQFIAAGLAIIPLAGLMGESTEHLAQRLGPGIGGLLNATFGNAAELIIALLRYFAAMTRW